MTKLLKGVEVSDEEWVEEDEEDYDIEGQVESLDNRFIEFKLEANERFEKVDEQFCTLDIIHTDIRSTIGNMEEDMTELKQKVSKMEEELHFNLCAHDAFRERLEEMKQDITTMTKKHDLAIQYIEDQQQRIRLFQKDRLDYEEVIETLREKVLSLENKLDGFLNKPHISIY